MTLTGRIAIAHAFGPPDVLAVERHPSPELPSGAVRVAVRAAGLNPVDARRRSGAFGGRPPLVFGSEFTGVVMESAHPAWGRGDEVMGWSANGADADLLIADGDRMAPKPPELDWIVAGGLSGAGNTALTTLAELDLPSGALMVVHGAAGGVGTVLTQLAVARGIRVIGTASDRNAEHLRALGAVPVAYGDGVAERITAAAAGAVIDASVDLAGTREAGDFAVAAARDGARSVTLVPETMSSHGIRLVQTRPSAAGIRELADAVLSGALTLPIETLPLEDIIEAHRRMDAKHARGKLVLDLSDNPHLTAFTKGA